mgnify:CR=1 FL=1
MFRNQFAVLFCLYAISASQALSQEEAAGQPEEKDPLVGRRVMTVVWGAEFKLGKDVVGVVELGKVFTVDGANGKWYHFRGKHGWMKKVETAQQAGEAKNWRKQADGRRQRTTA